MRSQSSDFRRLDGLALAALAGIGEQPSGHLGKLAMSGGGGQPHRCGVAADVVLDMPTNPADGVGCQATLEAHGIEAGDGSMQAQMAGPNEVGKLDVGLPVTAGDRDHKLAVTFPQIGQRGLAGLEVPVGLADVQKLPLPLRGQIRPIELRTNGCIQPPVGSRPHTALSCQTGLAAVTCLGCASDRGRVVLPSDKQPHLTLTNASFY